MSDPSLPPIVITEGSSSSSTSNINTIVPDPAPLLNAQGDDVVGKSRGPPLGDPSLSYLSLSSDSIRLPSSSERKSSPRGVAVAMLNGDVRRQRSRGRSPNENKGKENVTPKINGEDDRRGSGQEDQDEQESGSGSASASGRSTKSERILRFPRNTRSCVLTDGFVPLSQTDRLAIENIGKLLCFLPLLE